MYYQYFNFIFALLFVAMYFFIFPCLYHTCITNSNGQDRIFHFAHIKVCTIFTFFRACKKANFGF